MRQVLAPIITATCLSGLLLLWGVSEHRHARAETIRASVSMAESLLGALQGSLQATLRRGRGNSDRIKSIIESTLESTRIEHLLILQNGAPLSEVGTLSPPTPQTEEGHLLENSTFWLWRTIHLQNHAPHAGSTWSGFGFGRSMDDSDLDLTNQEQLILLGLNAAPLHERVRTESRRINTTVGIALFAVLIFTAAWVFILRNRELARELEQESLRAEHLSELQLSGAGLAHETKNPLGLIRGLAQQIRNNPETPENLRHIADSMMEQADIATARLGEFLAFSKKHSPNIQPVDLLEETRKVCELMHYDAEQNGITLTNEIKPGLILADPDMLTQVTVNLLTNALKGCGPGDRVTLSGARTKDDAASLIVSDTGSGIPAELLPEILKPYVTGRPDGHGLGLAIVRRVAEDHHWVIAIKSTLGRGTTVTISGLRCHRKNAS